MYFYYGNSGGIDKVISRELNSNSGYSFTIRNIFEQIIKNSPVAYKNKKVEDFNACFYCYDDRLGHNVYMITTDHSGYKNQFARYFIEER